MLHSLTSDHHVPEPKAVEADDFNFIGGSDSTPDINVNLMGAVQSVAYYPQNRFSTFNSSCNIQTKTWSGIHHSCLPIHGHQPQLQHCLGPFLLFPVLLSFHFTTTRNEVHPMLFWFVQGHSLAFTSETWPLYPWPYATLPLNEYKPS